MAPEKKTTTASAAKMDDATTTKGEEDAQNKELWTVAHEINVWYGTGRGESAEDYALEVEELLAQGRARNLFAVSRDGELLEQLFRQMHARLEEESWRTA